ncbi:MAG: C39 family peptidase [Bacteroidales bacterium]|nr:C39 family peptidase [Bacteroidales bacterium]
MKRVLPILLIAVFAFAACEKEPEPKPSPYDIGGNTEDPSGTTASIKVDQTSFNRYSPAGEVAVYVTVEGGAKYSASIPDNAKSWISLKSISGSESGFVHFAIAKNTTGESRTAMVAITYGEGLSKSIQISQDAKEKKDYFAQWGLEGELVSTVSNDRPYYWYVDQGNTGACSGVNCGPASTTMASNWFNGSLRITTEDARQEYYNNGGWWYTNDINGFLRTHGVSISQKSFGSTEALVSELKKGNIVILCLDMYYITYGDGSGQKVNKFYRTNGTGWGHFIVVKGYVETSTKLYCEVYDPYTMGNNDSNGLPKGMDRYYVADELLRSAGIWWSYMIVINGK